MLLLAGCGELNLVTYHLNFSAQTDGGGLRAGDHVGYVAAVVREGNLTGNTSIDDLNALEVVANGTTDADGFLELKLPDQGWHVFTGHVVAPGADCEWAVLGKTNISHYRVRAEFPMDYECD